MNDQSFWYLENIDVTGILCPTKIDQAKNDLSHRTFKKGDYIYMPEDQSDKIYFIMEGRIKIGAYSDSGREITKAILGKGEVFGELALAGEKQRRDFAYVMEDTATCITTLEEMRGLMRENKGLHMFFMRMLGSRVLEMEQRLESLVFKDSRSRIVEFIIDLVAKKGQRVGYEMLVRRFLTHQEIANLTATSRQTVTTVLNELRNKEILTFNRRRLLIRDMNLLKQEVV